jgi:hypothetical protein
MGAEKVRWALVARAVSLADSLWVFTWTKADSWSTQLSGVRTVIAQDRAIVSAFGYVGGQAG